MARSHSAEVRLEKVGVLFLAFLLSGFLVLPAAAGTPQAARPPSSMADSIAAIERVAPALMKEGEVPGLAAALVWDGKLAWTRGFGLQNAAGSDPVTSTSVFEAASLSKPVFAYAVLKLADAGKLDLDEPLNRYLPGDYDVGSDTRLGQITARKVLSHTSGFPNWRRPGGPLKIYFDPGDRFSYSGEGYVYLSRVVEKITGESTNEFVRRTVFQPLGMTSSSYLWDEAMSTRAVTRHGVLGRPGGKSKPTVANAAASLLTTADDYGRFIVAVLNGNGLSPTTRAQMLTPQVRVGKSGTNATEGPGGPLSDDLAWGLGWGLQTTPDGISFWHWGDNGDAKAYVVVFERSKRGLVVFTNSANGLGIMPDLVEAAIGGLHPALAWLDYDSFRSPSRTLLRAILASGAGAALRDYRQRRAGLPEHGQINESGMNSLGYVLLNQANRPQDAIEVFKLNVEDYPGSWNAHDSLGEAYAAVGNKELAVKSYRKSVELNPGNSSGVEALKKLGAELPSVPVPR